MSDTKTLPLNPQTSGRLLPESESSQCLLMDVHDTARALAICERTLATMTKEGEIPHVRIRTRVLYSPNDLREWIGKLTQGGGAAGDLGDAASEKNIENVLDVEDSTAYTSSNESDS